MSIEVVGLVLRAKTGLGTQAKMVLLGLADHAGPDGAEARPGVKTLAQYAECSARTVQRHLAALLAAEFISVQREASARRKGQAHGGVPTVYRIRLSALAALRPFRGDSASQEAASPAEDLQVIDASGQPVTPESDNVSPPSTRGDIPGTPGVTDPDSRGDTAMSPEPSLQQPSTEPSEKQPPVAAVLAQRTERQLLFEAICASFGIDWDVLPAGSATRGTINRQIPELVAFEIGATDVAEFTTWLRHSPDSPLVGGRRLTIGSLGKWAPYFRARPLSVEKIERSSLQALESQEIARGVRERLGVGGG